MNCAPSISKFSRGSTERSTSGFTLIEILAASLASALILVAVYGIFQRAMKSRDHAFERIHNSRQMQRAANTIRNDLRNAYISGVVLAVALEGGLQSQKSRFPGYLRFTTTTGKAQDGNAYGDVQQVEYYITDDGKSDTSNNTGTLLRVITRDLLASVQQTTREEQLLPNVASFGVTFFDGQAWQESWQYTDSTSTLPQAIRIRIQQTESSEHVATPPPLEIMVPWTTQPLTSSTTSTTGTSAN